MKGIGLIISTTENKDFFYSIFLLVLCLDQKKTVPVVVPLAIISLYKKGTLSHPTIVWSFWGKVAVLIFLMLHAWSSLFLLYFCTTFLLLLFCLYYSRYIWDSVLYYNNNKRQVDKEYCFIRCTWNKKRLIKPTINNLNVFKYFLHLQPWEIIIIFTFTY